MKTYITTLIPLVALLFSACDSSSSNSSQSENSSAEFESSYSSSIPLVESSVSSSSTSITLSSSSQSSSTSSSLVATEAQEHIAVVKCSEVSDDAFTPIKEGDSLHAQSANTAIELTHNEDGTKSVCVTSGSAYLLRG